MGNELSIREFSMNYFFMDRLHDKTLPFSMDENLLAEINVEEIVRIVVATCQISCLKTTDFMIYNLVFRICIAIKRIENGFLLERTSRDHFTERTLEYRTALKILARVESRIGLHFSSEEISFMAAHLKNETSAQAVFPKIDISEWKIRTQILETLMEIDRTTEYTLADDPILIDGLMLHCTLLLERLKSNTSLENPMLAAIETHQAGLLNIVTYHFSKMPAFRKYQVPKSEWAYITIHLAVAAERFYNTLKDICL